MTNPELIQSVAQFADQARELLDVSVRTNLLQTLTELGHPYGLLLGLSANSWPSILLCPSASSSVSADWSGNIYSDKTSWFTPFWLSKFANMWLLGGKSNAGEEDLSSGLPSSRNSIGRSDVLNDSFLEGPKAYEHRISIFATSLTGSKIIAFKNESGIGYKDKFGLTVLTPGALKSMSELGERPRELRVGRNSIGLGSSSIHLGTFRGETPYVIKSPQGDTLTQVNPGDTLGSIHVTSQANLLRNLSPLEKVNQITEDFMDLLKALDFGTPGLNDLQQKTINRAKSATIIGISHLVRLFGRKTGLPTWKLDVLPELVQRFHQHDSQAVSKAFGGTRKVKSSDVEMMVITPSMRQQLVVAI